MLPLHAARPDPDDFSQCWLDRVEVLYGPSAWVLGRCLERSRPDWSPTLGVIDPNPDQELPFSRWEGVALGERVARSGGRFRPLHGPGATLEAVRGPLLDHGIAHFACHGQWDPRDPTESGLALADGRLRLAELLSDRKCDAARLVALSACDTALSDQATRRGDDYLGLPAGFLLAGAKAVVGSLWSVADPITALLMDRFYEHLFASKGLAESLRLAQNELRAMRKDEAIDRLREAGARTAWLDRCNRCKRFLDETDDSAKLDHPYYWAGFAAYGSPAPVIDRTDPTAALS